MTAPLAAARPHHVAIAVADLDQAIAFWEGLFGFTVQFRFTLPALGARAAFVGRGGFQIELWQRDGAAPVPPARREPNRDLLEGGTKHLAFEVPDLGTVLPEVERFGARILARQATPDQPMVALREPPAPGETVFAAFICDPFGTLIELIGAG